MPIHAHRSHRVEDLTVALALALRMVSPRDPFEPVPVVLAGHGLGRWMRHELATHLGAVARLQLLSPRAAFERAAAWVTAADNETRPAVPLWDDPSRPEDPWAGAMLRSVVITSLRARLGEPAFAAVREYLGPLGGSVTPRELLFAEALSGVVERLHHERPETAHSWSTDADRSPAEHLWIARLLADLSRTIPSPSPAVRMITLRAVEPRSGDRPALLLFGMSALRASERAWLDALAPHLDLHLFGLTPWESGSSRSARPGQPHNPALASYAAPARDLDDWLCAHGVAPSPVTRPPEAPRTLLQHVQTWIVSDAPVPAGTPWQPLAACPSLEIHACHGSLRQCEAHRAVLHANGAALRARLVRGL